MSIKLHTGSDLASDMGEEGTEAIEATPEENPEQFCPWESTAGATKMTREQLMAIHNDSQEKGFSWASGQAIKDAFQLPGHVLALLSLHYDLPRIRFDSRKDCIYSLPALNWILSNAPELQDASDLRPLRDTLEDIEAEATEKVRTDFIDRLNNKLKTI